MEPKLWAGVCELFVKAKFFGNVALQTLFAEKLSRKALSRLLNFWGC